MTIEERYKSIDLLKSINTSLCMARVLGYKSLNIVQDIKNFDNLCNIKNMECSIKESIDCLSDITSKLLEYVTYFI